jgi:hypothetical protein
MSCEEQTVISRREWLELTTVNTLACAVLARRAAAQTTPSSLRESRIRRIIQAYDEQGFHRTGTSVDHASANWLRDEVRQSGLTGSLEPFPLHRIDPQSAALIVGDRRIEGLPLFDAAFTGERGLRGRLGSLDSAAEIGVVESIPNAAGAGPLGDARRKSRHKAIICTTRGSRPGLCPSNADSFLEPFGPPVLQVAGEHAVWLQEEARRGTEVQVLAHVRRSPAEAFNVTARVTGADSALLPLVIMTPRSGWYRCTSERGGGLACWLELIRILREAKPARDVVFVASSGHELGHLGINAFVDRRPGIVSRSIGWVHLGANIGAASRAANQASPADSRFGLPPSASLPQAQGNTVQASDDELERMLTQAVTSTGLSIDVRMPRGRVPDDRNQTLDAGGVLSSWPPGVRYSIRQHPPPSSPTEKTLSKQARRCESLRLQDSNTTQENDIAAVVRRTASRGEQHVPASSVGVHPRSCRIESAPATGESTRLTPGTSERSGAGARHCFSGMGLPSTVDSSLGLSQRDLARTEKGTERVHCLRHLSSWVWPDGVAVASDRGIGVQDGFHGKPVVGLEKSVGFRFRQ